MLEHWDCGRHWEESDTDDSNGVWDLYWASIQSVYRIFQPDGIRLEASQVINHFPNHIELTRKDLLVKNIKRYQKTARREGEEATEILPATFILPNDTPLFVEEFKRQANATWIMKPANRAQGRGIFLINRLSQLKRWERFAPLTRSGAPETWVVSRYIGSPFLIGGRKFDLRLYVLVTSFKPLRVYISQHGFARFCAVPYDARSAALRDKLVHLTNVAVQRRCEEYNCTHGNKWPLSKLRLWLEGTRGAAVAEHLFAAIDAVILTSLRACQPAIINDRHCFELYGYDVIIDSDLRPWLIEVNASPSLAASTPADRKLKERLISDVLDVIAPGGALAGLPGQLASEGAAAVLGASTRPHSAAGIPLRRLRGKNVTVLQPLASRGMRLLFDETDELGKLRAARDALRAEVGRSRRATALSCC